MAQILWVPAFEPGSYFPAVPIALELVRRGHRLTVLCEPRSRATFESLGFAFGPTDALSRHVAGFDAAAHGGGRAAKLAWHAGYVRSLYADASRELAAGPYDAVMIDPLEPGADFAAEAMNVPSFSYVHWRMNETGTDVPFCFHFWDRRPPASQAFIEWWNEQRALVGLDPEPRPVDEHRWYRHSRRLTLILGLPELVDRKASLPDYAVRVGPTIWDPPFEGSLPDWIATLGGERPAILASVSTVGQLDTELLAAVADAVRDEDVDVIATVTRDGELPPLPGNLRLVRFLPHSAVLPHVSAVVSHAGNGTTTRAACAGVPLLLLPAGRDQFEVARGAAAAGIAVVLDRGRIDPAETRRALRALLHDRPYRERALELARRAAAYNAPETAADAVDVLLLSTRARAERTEARLL